MTLTLQRTFEEMGAPLHDVPFCILDLETTGTAPDASGITEIGAVLYKGGEELGTFQTLVNPGQEIPPFITVLTGITHSMVVGAPKIDEALPTFLEFMGNAVIVGHNVRFDLSFLNAAATHLGYGRLCNRSVDTLGLARRLLRGEVRNLKLDTLAAHFRSPHRPTHRALADAQATAWVLHRLLELAGTMGVTALEDLLQLPTARGSRHYEKIHLADALPRRPGVYLFRDRSGGVFYVGKAKNLRTRVRSYFYGDDRRTVATMLQELDRIDHRECATELEAEVTELRLIHSHRPRHNRRSKPPKSSHWVKLTHEAFPRLSLVRSQRDDGGMYLGPFRSRRSAELVLTAIWDAVPIRRCSSKAGTRGAPCAPAQLGVALCPCDGSLSKERYAPVVSIVLSGIGEDPSLLLEPLIAKMSELAVLERYEEAAWVRDRYRALARALTRRREWQAMNQAGVVWAESAEGEGAVIDRGRLSIAWNGRHGPMLAPPVDDASNSWPQTPPSVEIAEEAHLVWQWLTGQPVRLLDATRPLMLPRAPVPELSLANGALRPVPSQAMTT
ncbi:MAG: DEDD exonuclease domain-containing protein [Acidimicrobiia bacterium]